MGFSIGDRVISIENEAAVSVGCAMSIIKARADIAGLPPGNPLSDYLGIYWTLWRNYYQETKPPGTPDLPQFVVP